jgi:4-amino-4-deoxy-L-arabinose transferase-like glycosyltransferase
LVVRLPMILAGIGSLPLMYFAGRETFGQSAGLFAMFCLAISPWHVLLSRWGLESNILPFVFLCAYVCALLALRRIVWFIPASVLFGLALYSYGTAYAAVPVFMLLCVSVLTRQAFVRRRDLAVGSLAFCAVATPIALFLIVNTFRLPQIDLGSLTIPRLPAQPRYEETTLLGQRNVMVGLANNAWTGLSLLVTESDGIIYNTVPPFGVFYHLLLPASLLGIGVLIHQARRSPQPQHWLLFAWLGAALLPAFLQPVNINRFNIALVPLLICCAGGLGWIGGRFALAVPAMAVVLLAAFIAFNTTYHGVSYRGQIGQKFHRGLLPALHFAAAESDDALCITNQINMPYIFALFSDPMRPASFLETVRYEDPQAPFRQVLSFSRYVFGSHNCLGASPYTYVLTTAEIPPRLGNRYSYRFFDDFVAYYPRR